MTRPETAFYCVSDARYFLGAVGMINSLRLHGHDEPIHILDCGLTATQRELLAPQGSVVSAPEEAPPWMLKTVAPFARPAEVMVLIDADVIVTRPMTDLIQSAAAGRVLAFENNVDRYVAEWGELLDLGPLERRPYICSAFMAAGRPRATEIVRLMDDRQRRVDFEQTFYGTNDPRYPFLYPDQDVLNAVLAACVEKDRMVTLERRLLAPMPFEGVRIVDERAVRCAFEDGVEPYLLHYILPAKPWLQPMPDGIYPRLLKRLLSGPDLAIRVPEEELPLRFRRGALAATERKRVDLVARLRWRLGLALHRLRA